MYSFYVYFLVFCVLLYILCFMCLCNFCVLFLPVYTVVYFLFVYNFTDHFHWMENRLQLINTVPYYRAHFTNWVINTCVQQNEPKANTLSRGFKHANPLLADTTLWNWREIKHIGLMLSRLQHSVKLRPTACQRGNHNSEEPAACIQGISTLKTDALVSS
jgi:hypothetical protein